LSSVIGLSHKKSFNLFHSLHMVSYKKKAYIWYVDQCIWIYVNRTVCNIMRVEDFGERQLSLVAQEGSSTLPRGRSLVVEVSVDGAKHG